MDKKYIYFITISDELTVFPPLKNYLLHQNFSLFFVRFRTDNKHVFGGRIESIINNKYKMLVLLLLTIIYCLGVQL